MGRGTITIEVDPITPEQIERYRGIFTALIASGGLSVRSGQSILHFDQDGTLQAIEAHEKRWVRKKDTSKTVV